MVWVLNVIIMSDVLYGIGLSESVPGRTGVWFRKKPMDLCGSEIEECEDGVSPDVNTVRG
jgi:hypothetical protein